MELSKEFLIFNNTEYGMPTRVMPTGAMEEAADVVVVADVLLDKLYAAYDRRILHSMVGSILNVVKGKGLIHIKES